MKCMGWVAAAFIVLCLMTPFVVGSAVAHFLFGFILLPLAAECWPILLVLSVIAVCALCDDSSSDSGECHSLFEVAAAGLGIILGMGLGFWLFVDLSDGTPAMWEAGFIAFGAEAGGILVGLLLGGGYRFRSYPEPVVPE